MKRIFTLALAALALVAVALISAFIAMRLAIHGREVDVPTLTGLTVAEANTLSGKNGLNLNLENRFYSNEVPAGRVLSQYPDPSTLVRRGSEVRISESLGPQRVTIPDLIGLSERAATVSIRRLSLELGAVAHLPAPGDPDVVLAQTPPSNSGGVDGPRISLLVTYPLPTPELEPEAYVMPSLIGLSFPAASARAATAGLHVTSSGDPAPAPTPAAAAPKPRPVPPQVDLLNLPIAPAQPAASAPSTPAPYTHPGATVFSQSPAPGSRVVRGDTVHIVLSHPGATTP